MRRDVQSATEEMRSLRLEPRIIGVFGDRQKRLVIGDVLLALRRELEALLQQLDLLIVVHFSSSISSTLRMNACSSTMILAFGARGFLVSA